MCQGLANQHAVKRITMQSWQLIQTGYGGLIQCELGDQMLFALSRNK